MMSSKSIYLVKLQPLDLFFFGKEKWSLLGNRTDYYLQSNYLPQQTAVLGLLRYTLLLNRGWLNPAEHKKKDEARKLIGPQSFAAQGVINQEFGLIDSISPLFIKKGRVSLFPCPKDLGLDVFLAEGKTIFDQADPNIGHAQKQLDYIPLIPNYDPKQGTLEKLIASDGKLYSYKYDKEKGPDGVFEEVIKPGNQKDYENKANQQGKILRAYYKQQFFRLRAGYTFACYVTLDEQQEVGGKKLELEGKSFNVAFGGERSPFTISFSKPDSVSTEGAPNTVFSHYKSSMPKTFPYKMVLLSDAYLPQEEYRKADFTIAETTSFRNLETNVEETTHYSNLKRKSATSSMKFTRISKRFELIEKGAVLYFEKKEAVKNMADALREEAHFRKIGYNQFRIINNTDINL